MFVCYAVKKPLSIDMFVYIHNTFFFYHFSINLFRGVVPENMCSYNAIFCFFGSVDVTLFETCEDTNFFIVLVSWLSSGVPEFLPPQSHEERRSRPMRTDGFFKSGKTASGFKRRAVAPWWWRWGAARPEASSQGRGGARGRGRDRGRVRARGRDQLEK